MCVFRSNALEKKGLHQQLPVTVQNVRLVECSIVDAFHSLAIVFGHRSFLVVFGSRARPLRNITHLTSICFSLCFPGSELPTILQTNGSKLNWLTFTIMLASKVP